MLVDKQSELMSGLLFTVHQHGGDDVTWKPPILRAQKKYSKRMDNALTLFWRKTSDRKRDTSDRKLLLSALEETTLK